MHKSPTYDPETDQKYEHYIQIKQIHLHFENTGSPPSHTSTGMKCRTRRRRIAMYIEWSCYSAWAV
jgi:hypothetical protein